MSITGHLSRSAVFLLLFFVLTISGRRSHRYHEPKTSSNKNELKDFVRGTSLASRHRETTKASLILGEPLPNMISIDHFRKPFDKFKWPWKNYEDWKRHQKKIEDKIDRMLKPRNRRFPSRPKKIVSPKKTVKPQTHEADKTSRKKHKKKRLSGGKKSIQVHHEPIPLKMSTETTRVSSVTDREFPTGGVILAVKYYSTND